MIDIPVHRLALQDFEPAHIARIERYGAEFLAATVSFGFDSANYYFSGADAMSYYCLLREMKPDSVVEVGQGSSTRVAIAALEKNAAETGIAARFVSIDPYTRILGSEVKPQQIIFECVHQPIQAVPVEDILSRCQGNALLFIDSSHVHKHGSDVWHLMRYVYPRIPVGCHLHVHDIVLPHPWPKNFLVDRKWFWNEQDMLEAFLTFNTNFQVALPVYWLHNASTQIQAAMQKVAPDLHCRDQGYSFYMKRIS
ncbi:MAG: class I SAM-dependent methyltransferase [Verrucomicrobiaceae bacterium]|nr:class I SAM-dependent methyltransferase [Verrucomicrobiaceae bacterium]